MSTRVLLKVPQARVLVVLIPEYPEDPPEEWPLVTRSALGARAGYTALSGTVNRALHGIKRDGKSGKASPGLIDLGLIQAIDIDVDGFTEVNYRITSEGLSAIQAYLADGGLPDMREAEKCTNKRYSLKETEADAEPDQG